ncbi:hypothetical protein Tco_1559134, partial [Tanacetum coccineum]
MVNDGGPPLDHHRTTAGPPVNHRSTVVDRQLTGWSGRVMGRVRFLVSEKLLLSCPHLNAITLERFLSDHRPILLRKNKFDYGPIPFRFFHHWIDMEGFCKLVEDSWKNSPSINSNAMKILM